MSRPVDTFVGRLVLVIALPFTCLLFEILAIFFPHALGRAMEKTGRNISEMFGDAQ